MNTPTINALASASTDELKNAKLWQFLQDTIRSKPVSGLVALFFIVTTLVVRGPEASFLVFGFLLLPLACIWFADGLGNLTGISLGLGRPMITQTTPGEFIAIVGWLLLICPLLVAFLTW